MAEDQQIPQIQQNMILASTWASKANSKREIYVFLCVDLMVYLPGYDTITIYFLKDIISSKAKHVKSSSIKHIYCPQYETLTIKVIMVKIEEHLTLMQYFPSCPKERYRLPKQWVLNIAYTIVGDDFAIWIKSKIQARNLKVTKEKDMLIAVDPEIAQIFQKSTAVSLQKGSSANLLKVGSKRRRTTTQVKEDKLKEELEREQIKNHQAQMLQLQEELAQEKEKAAKFKHNSDLIIELEEKGAISFDDQGKCLYNEGQFIQEDDG